MAQTNNKNNNVFFSIGTIVALNVATVINIYGFPSEAFYGLSSVTLYGIALLIFMVPVALVSAELGSMFPQQGGVYTWVTNAFSHRVGLFAIWLQWIQSVFFYPLSLTFAAVTFSYVVIDQSLAVSIAQNQYYVMAFILIVFWFCTFISAIGLKRIGWMSKYGVWIGIIIPMIVLVALAAYYVADGGEIQMDMSPSSLIPRFSNLDQVVMAISIMLFFSGLEVNGVHVHMMKNPSKDYPKAIFIAALIIGLIYILGTLAIAVVISADQINITQSVIMAFKKYLSFAGGEKLISIIAVALCFGVIANTLTWITGPADAIKSVAVDGHMPEIVQKQNKHGAPIVILLSQAVIVTILCFVYVISSKVQQGYQLLLQITNALYLTMYIVLFISFIRLRYTKPMADRTFKAGKNMIVAWIIALVGIVSALCSFVICFMPPMQLDITHKNKYIFLLICVYCILILPPILYAWIRDRRIKQKQIK